MNKNQVNKQQIKLRDILVHKTILQNTAKTIFPHAWFSIVQYNGIRPINKDIIM